MEHNVTVRLLKIPWSIIEQDDSGILLRYIQFRAWKHQRVWLPCIGGYICFGTDATTFIGGMQSTYMSIPMCFTDEPGEGQFLVRLPPSKIAPTGVRNKIDLMLLKLFGILK